MGGFIKAQGTQGVEIPQIPRTLPLKPGTPCPASPEPCAACTVFLGRNFPGHCWLWSPCTALTSGPVLVAPTLGCSVRGSGDGDGTGDPLGSRLSRGSESRARGRPHGRVHQLHGGRAELLADGDALEMGSPLQCTKGEVGISFPQRHVWNLAACRGDLPFRKWL